MTGDVGHHLRRLSGPWLFRIVHLRHVYLRMGNGTGDAKLDALLTAGSTAKPAGFLVVVEGAAQTVAYLVRESGNARHLADVGLHAQLFIRQGTRPGAPALAVDEDGRVELRQFLTDGVHRLDVVTAHEVEAETVNAVLVVPVLDALNHKTAHEGLFGSRLIATAGAVAVRPAPVPLGWSGAVTAPFLLREGSGGCFAIVIVGIG